VLAFLILYEEAMTKEQLQGLKDLCSAATPGPWTIHPDEDCQYNDVYTIRNAKTYSIGEALNTDAAFIAAARTALPELIAEVERLQSVWDEVLAITGTHAMGSDPARAVHQALLDWRARE
jgi:hypothetical protein